MAPAVLEPELTLATEAAPPPRVVAAFAGVDPLRLDLPALPSARVAPEALHALSALYLAARLEDAAVLPAVEALVRQRATLRIGVATAAKLEELARRQGQLLAPAQRTALFARLFGSGTDDPASAGLRFEPRLAALCSALVACGPRPAGAVDGLRIPVELAARDLAEVAGSVVGGGAALAVGRLNDHLRRALDLLADPGIGALVGARGAWETLRRLLGAGAPDLGRLLDCGRHGQRLLLWLAVVAGGQDARAGVAGPIGPDVVASAAAWLTACGLPPRGPGEGSI